MLLALTVPAVENQRGVAYSTLCTVHDADHKGEEAAFSILPTEVAAEHSDITRPAGVHDLLLVKRQTVSCC